MGGLSRGERKPADFRLGETITAGISLCKMPSVALNMFSGWVGIVLASGRDISWSSFIVLLAAGGMVAAGSGCINCYLDRDIDRLMSRTCYRPLVTGKVNPAANVLRAGIILIASGLTVALIGLAPASTLFVALGAAIYVLVYTMWLKRKTHWSIIVGGLAGSCALLAGWFAVRPDFGSSPLIFSILIFLWTPGHFWALAVRTGDETEKAKIPTLPNVHGHRTAVRCTAVLNSGLVCWSALPYLLSIVGGLYVVVSLVSGSVFLLTNIKLYLSQKAEMAWLTFKLSGPYLAMIYAGVMLDSFVA